MALDIVGHEKTLQRLVSILERDRLANALLFGGPEGIGKLLAARWFAARILCRSDTSPCFECEACRQTEAETHPDLTVLRRASGKKEIGIDLVRALKRFLSLRSVYGARKLAIIDDADRLSLPAQNALLKTLEEPPGHAIVILVTASPGGLLSTVRSRVQRVHFEPLRREEVVRVLRERCGIESADATLLASTAEGRPGLALSLRGLLKSENFKNLIGLLAELDPARYVSVLRVARALGSSEAEMWTRIELLVVLYREIAVRAISGSRPASWIDGFGDLPALDAETAVRCSRIATRTLRILRFRNPNRPVLAETLALRLARS